MLNTVALAKHYNNEGWNKSESDFLRATGQALHALAVGSIPTRCLHLSGRFPDIAPLTEGMTPDQIRDAAAAELQRRQDEDDYTFQITAPERAAIDNVLKGGTALYTEGGHPQDRHPKSSYYVWKLYEDGAVVFTRTIGGDVSVDVHFLDGSERFNQLLKDFAEAFPKPKKEAMSLVVQRSVYVLLANGPNIEAQSLGHVHAAFEPDNYDEKTVVAFNKVVEELESDTPTGRLTILDGPPGSGKSFFLRGLVERVYGAMFVYVPSDLVVSLGGPAMMPVLFDLKRRMNVPIVLVLEDADAVLAPRMTDNISSVSTILNFTDGMFGELLNLRMIATTNQKKAAIDDALMRDMRLSQHIHIAQPSRDKVSSILTRLLKTEPATVPEGIDSLSAAYRYARQCGWVPPKRKSEEVEGASNLIGENPAGLTPRNGGQYYERAAGSMRVERGLGFGS